MSEIRSITDVNNEFFKKSHRLVFSQLGLSPVEHDIFALLLSSLHKDQWADYINNNALKSPVYEFNAQLLSEWFGVNSSSLYSVLSKPSKRLASKAIGLKDDNAKEFKFISLFKEISYRQGVLTIVPNDRLMKEYLGVSQGHSQIPHLKFRRMKLEHAKRLYTMLCRFKESSTQLHAQTLDQLHAFFGLKDENNKLVKKTYAVTGNFIKKIIKPAILQIEEVEPDITFLVDQKTGNLGFAYHKKGRKITGIEFLFTWKKKSPIEKKIKNSEELTIDDAQITLNEIKNKSRLPSDVELTNLQKNLGSLILIGEVTEEVLTTFKLLMKKDF
jgi:plasmid replication initiation protein